MEIIEFAVFLTGHDKQTIEKMYAEWSRYNVYQENVFEDLVYTIEQSAV